jgi:hypothetical protein
MSLGEILDTAIQMLKSKLGLFAGIAFFPGLALLILSMASNYAEAGTDAPAPSTLQVVVSYAATFAVFLAWVVVHAMSRAAFSLAASRVYLGEPVTIRAAYGAFASRKGSLVGLGILRGIYAFWPLIPVAILGGIIVAALSVPANSPIYWIVIVGLITLGGIPSIALYSRYALAYPAAAIEDRIASSAIDRSIELGQGRRWKVCFGFLLPTGIGVAFNYGVTALIELLKQPRSPLADSPLTLSAIDEISTLLLSLVFSPLTAIVLTLLYYDLRVRKESFDVVHMLDETYPDEAYQEADLPRGSGEVLTGQETLNTQTSTEEKP